MQSIISRQTLRTALRCFSTKSTDTGMLMGSYIQKWPLKKCKNSHSMMSSANLDYKPNIFSQLTTQPNFSNKIKLKYRNVQLHCTNCDSSVEPANRICCGKCGFLLKANNNYDYYQLYQLNSFFVCKEKLKSQREMLQNLVNDQSKNPKNKENASNWLEIINEAYFVLRSPIKRAQYRLKENGIILPNAYAVDESYKILNESIQADIAQANSITDIKDLYELTQKEIEDETKTVSGLMESEDYQNAINSLVKIQFLEEEIEQPIKLKLKEIHSKDMATLMKRRQEQKYFCIY